MTDNDHCGVRDCDQSPTHEVYFIESWYVMCERHATEEANTEGCYGICPIEGAA